MRYRIALVALLLSAGGRAAACDLCSTLQGINPFYSSSNTISLHLLVQRSSSPGSLLQGAGGSKLVAPPDRRVYHAGSHGAGPTSESMTTVELAYRHHISDRVMATVLVPAIRSVHRSETRLAVQGIGDPSALIHYVAGDALGSGTTLLIGAGMKLPLGRNDLRDGRGDLLEPRMQPGSGSPAALLAGTLSIPIDRWTLAVDLFGSLPTTNGRGDRLGASGSGTISSGYDLVRSDGSGFVLSATAGLRAETAGHDRIEGAVDAGSGFTAAYGSLGGAILLGPARLDLTVLLPIRQARADGTEEDARIMSGIRFEL